MYSIISNEKPSLGGRWHAEGVTDEGLSISLISRPLTDSFSRENPKKVQPGSYPIYIQVQNRYGLSVAGLSLPLGEGGTPKA